MSRIPQSDRKQPGFKKRYSWFINMTGAITLSIYGYSLLGTAFTAIPSDYQWILTFVSAIVKEFFSWLLLSASYKAAGMSLHILLRIHNTTSFITPLGPGSNDRDSIVFPVTFFIEMRHTVFIAITLGSVATLTTSYLMVAMGFLMNVYECYKIIRNIKRKKSSVEDGTVLMSIKFNLKFLSSHLIYVEQSNIEMLVMIERMETLVPIMYMTLMTLAYYGPNADILGNIKASFWQYQSPITDIVAFNEILGILAMIDFTSFLLNGSLLWCFCKRNVFKALQSLQSKYWFLMATTEAYYFVEVRMTKIRIYSSLR